MADICVKTSTCKQLVITDNYDWGAIEPSISVSNTLITLKYISSTSTGDVITIVDEDEYVSTIDVLPSTILSSWTKIQDGYYQIKSQYTIGTSSPGSMSFSLDIQPTLNTYSNFNVTATNGSNFTFQWYFNGAMIGSDTTETAANMVAYANTEFTTNFGFTFNVIASSVGNVITFTTTENTTFYNQHNHFYINNKQAVDGGYATGLYTLITGDSTVDVNDDIYMYISGGAIASVIKTYSEVFNKCNQDCKIDNQIADFISNDECDSCNKDIEKDILNIALKSTLLCYAITCSNKNKVWELYNYINNILLENNCKSC